MKNQTDKKEDAMKYFYKFFAQSFLAVEACIFGVTIWGIFSGKVDSFLHFIQLIFAGNLLFVSLTFLFCAFCAFVKYVFSINNPNAPSFLDKL